MAAREDVDIDKTLAFGDHSCGGNVHWRTVGGYLSIKAAIFQLILKNDCDNDRSIIDHPYKLFKMDGYWSLYVDGKYINSINDVSILEFKEALINWDSLSDDYIEIPMKGHAICMFDIAKVFPELKDLDPTVEHDIRLSFVLNSGKKAVSQSSLSKALVLEDVDSYIEYESTYTDDDTNAHHALVIDSYTLKMGTSNTTMFVNQECKGLVIEAFDPNKELVPIESIDVKKSFERFARPCPLFGVSVVNITDLIIDHTIERRNDDTMLVVDFPETLVGYLTVTPKSGYVIDKMKVIVVMTKIITI